MKNTAYIFIAFLMITFTVQATNTPSKISSETTLVDKDFLLNFYTQTAIDLKRHIEGLTENQLHYKPSDDSWSIAETVEHIIIVEQGLFEMSREIIRQEPNPDARNEIQINDDEMLESIINRSHKAKAPEAVQPTGMYADIQAGLEEFENVRNQIMALLEEMPMEDLRNRVGESPIGLVDGYQSFLFIAGHTARHLEQIQEIKESDGFPDE